MVKSVAEFGEGAPKMGIMQLTQVKRIYAGQNRRSFIRFGA
jgi:hypothetical protein